jgi:phosphatidylglycerol:prolipoprotein diacylglycerol transferase
VILYTVWVALGIALAALAARWQGEPTGLPQSQRSALLLWAALGAIAGAYGLQLPADLLGFAAPPPPGLQVADAVPLGGRTVLGGLLGGWLAVEVGKRRLGVRTPTGDAFALPLAIALGCGRLGCAAAGCCAGVRCAPHWWAYVDAVGEPRLPVQVAEAGFHFAAAIVLAVAARSGSAGGPWRGRRLAAYLALYAVVRFLLEFARENPPVLLGLSWHQLLAIALLLLAGGTWWRRR